MASIAATSTWSASSSTAPTPSGLAAGAVTLYPDPVRVLRPHEPMQYLTSLEERLELLRGLGLDFVVPLSFTSELAELSPRDLRRRCCARSSTCGC